MEKVLDYIRKNGMVQRGDRIIAGVSGGPTRYACFFCWINIRRLWG